MQRRATCSARCAQLVAAGQREEHVDTGVLLIPAMGEFAEGLLDVARDQQCGTIFVGRNSPSWLREAFHHHPADELVKKAHGVRGLMPPAAWWAVLRGPWRLAVRAGCAAHASTIYPGKAHALAQTQKMARPPGLEPGTVGLEVR